MTWMPPPRGNMKETPSTRSPVRAGELRFARTIEDDTFENPGLYLVLEQADRSALRDGELEDSEGRACWRCLALHEDPDLENERAGTLVEHGETWLINWTEPYAP